MTDLNNDTSPVVVFDLETTGFNPGSDKIVEIGAIELINKKPTGRVFHEYVDPGFEVPEEAAAVHGLMRDDIIELGNGQTFKDVAKRFQDFIAGSILVAHNASFDIGFVDQEFSELGMKKPSSYCSVVDTLKIARAKFPNNRNTLDSLCKRFGIDNSSRTSHGALLDSELLVDVYLGLTESYGDLLSSIDVDEEISLNLDTEIKRLDLPELMVIRPSANEFKAHCDYVDMLEKVSGGNAIYRPESNNLSRVPTEPGSLSL